MCVNSESSTAKRPTMYAYTPREWTHTHSPSYLRVFFEMFRYKQNVFTTTRYVWLYPMKRVVVHFFQCYNVA